MAAPDPTPPPADPTDELVFHDFHRPLVHDGTFKLTEKHRLDATPDAHAEGTDALALRISGPQTSLPQGSVVSTYPPAMSSGDYSAVLPHVTLSRGTLPWERRLHRAIGDSGTTTPWMLVLVLSDKEFQSAVVTTTKARQLDPTILHDDVDDDEHVAVLEIPSDYVATLFPAERDLPWLAHVRSIHRRKGAPPDPATATVVASRTAIPSAQNHVFLISIEGRYDNAPIADTAMFPILHQWTFVCADVSDHGFVEQLTTVDGRPNPPEPFTVATSAPVDREVAQRVDAGFVPLRHRTRTGEVAASWYHGPLLPGAAPLDAEAISARLPADQSDDLLLLDEQFDVFDVSYAAAWELGRLLVLRHTDVATSLFHWKRRFAHTRHRAANPATTAGSYRVGLPEPDPEIPSLVADFLERSLLQLRDVPFRYLVPDEAALPPSAIRFFDVDVGWLDCLRDGALSVGRTDSRARRHEREVRTSLSQPRQISGVLVRSGAVSDFPQLEVAGYATIPDGPSLGSDPLPIFRLDRLSSSVLLVLFDGQAAAVDLHLHPQAIHFGFDRDSRESLFKEVDGRPVPLEPDSGSTSTVGVHDEPRIDMSVLASRLKDASWTPEAGVPPPEPGDVARFARTMLAGVPLVRFTRQIRAGK